MKTNVVTSPINSSVRSSSLPVAAARLAFLDNLRYLMIVLVLLYHAVAAYAIVAPHWVVHDTSLFAADLVREFFDVFMMPVLFFVSGYFALVSLEKKGVWSFLKDKVKRLLVPWALAVFFVAPLALYDTPVKPVQPFWKYWLWYLGQFPVQLRPSQTPTGPTTQMIYWFLSLLFAFCLALALGYALVHRARGTLTAPATGVAPSSQSIWQALVAFGLLTTAAYFVLLLFVPDSSWFTLSAFLEFQVTRLVPYAGCFAFGVYAQARGWFTEGRPIGGLGLWGVASAALAAAYLVVGQPMFADTAGTASFAIGYLLLYAFLRSFLLLALLVVFVSFGIRFWNYANGVDRQMAAASFNIYLVHFFIVVALQMALVGWVGGPEPIKIAIVFLTALALSFAISRWILARHSRAFGIVLLAFFAFCLIARP